MADIKLIALDLDGTLLTTDKKLTDRTKAINLISDITKTNQLLLIWRDCNGRY